MTEQTCHVIESEPVTKVLFPVAEYKNEGSDATWLALKTFLAALYEQKW